MFLDPLPVLNITTIGIFKLYQYFTRTNRYFYGLPKILLPNLLTPAFNDP